MLCFVSFICRACSNGTKTRHGGFEKSAKKEQYQRCSVCLEKRPTVTLEDERIGTHVFGKHRACRTSQPGNVTANSYRAMPGFRQTFGTPGERKNEAKRQFLHLPEWEATLIFTMLPATTEDFLALKSITP